MLTKRGPTLTNIDLLRPMFGGFTVEIRQPGEAER